MNDIIQKGAMAMSIIFNKRDPIYLQVMQHFKKQIVAGKLAPGEEVPSRRELARTMQINPNTVQRAYSEMEAQKLIYTEPNRPSKITEDPTILKELRKEWLDKAITNFANAIRPIDISMDEVMELLQEELLHGPSKKEDPTDD
jgi:DNA-binding transcriptional regulator YhcF (GntR family)